MKTYNLILALLLLSTTALISQDAPFSKQAEHGFFPVAKKNFRPQISVAPQIGFFSFPDISTGGLGLGLELAMQCPLACTKKNYIRQQVSFITYQNSEDAYNYWNVSINPEYRLLVSPSYELAVGPSVGFFSSSYEGETSNGLSYGISSSFTLHFGKYMLGLSPRYLLSKSIETPEGELSQNGFLGILKLGYKI